MCVPCYRHIDSWEGISLSDCWIVGWLGFRAGVDVVGKSVTHVFAGNKILFSYL